SRHDTHFVVAHVAIAEPGDVKDVLAAALRDGDVVAAYAPGELELLLVEAGADEARDVLDRMEALLSERRIDARLGEAWFPRDGRDASSLTARARARALGEVAEPPDESQIVVDDERMKALH